MGLPQKQKFVSSTLTEATKKMKKEYYLGRRNQRTNYWLYVKETAENYPDSILWWKAIIKNDELLYWSYCIMIPKDIKKITDQEAQEFLFPFCI